MSEPTINITTHLNNSVSSINMPKSANSSINAVGIVLNNGNTSIGNLSVKTSSATVLKKDGQILGVENGKIDVDLADLQFGKRDGKPFWSTMVNTLYVQKPNSLFLGKNKNKLSMQEINLGNVTLSSEYVSNVDKLFKFNLKAWLRTATGEYIDSAKTIKWFNAATPDK